MSQKNPTLTDSSRSTNQGNLPPENNMAAGYRIAGKISGSIAYPITKTPSMLLGGSATPFNPASISGLRSRLLDANTFTSPIDSKYYLADSSTTNTHLPRQGRAWLFDGSNDFGTRAQLTTGTAMTVAAIVKPTDVTSTRCIASEYGTNFRFVFTNDGGKLRLQVYTLGSANYRYDTDNMVLINNTEAHVAFTLSGGTVAIYVNGASVPVTLVSGTPGNITASSEVFRVGNLNGSLWPFAGSIREIRVFSVAKSAAEVAAIAAGNDDLTGLLAHFPCGEESGTTGYDISGNGNHLTLTNITQETFHATDTGVLANRNNAEGYRLSGSVYIPKRLSDSLAADGNALTVTGRAAYHGCVETPCFTGNASNCYIDLGAALFPSTADFETEFWFYRLDSGTWTYLLTQDNSVRAVVDTSNRVAFHDGSNYYYTASNTVIPNTWHHFRVIRVGSVFTTHLTPSGGSTVTATSTNAATFSTSTNTLLGNLVGAGISGRLSNFRITTGGVTTYFPLQDGPGSSNTNRDIAWVKSDGTGGVISNAIVNGTVSTIWGNRVPGNVEDWCVKYGGRIAANGAFIAGMLTGGNAADGSAKTLAAGKFGNPFSRLNFNPATAAELNGRSVPTAATVSTNINTTITPSNSAFKRTKTDGDDRFLIYDDTLSGADLTNVEGYVA